MSLFSFDPKTLTSKSPAAGSLGSAFSKWLIKNHGAKYKQVVSSQRERAKQRHFSHGISTCSQSKPTDKPIVGIVGGGFAGLYSGLILQSLGIEFEIFEASDRVGGRIDTWYSSNYSATDVDKSGLYGEVGGMRLPQFSSDMLPVQQLALSVNAVLDRNGFSDDKVIWRKFYYDSPVQRMRFNNMPTYIEASDSSLNSLNFDQKHGGDIPQVWFTEKTDSTGKKYLPINMVLDKVNDPFISAINKSFSEGFEMMMQYDQHSMWSYLTNVFTLGDLAEYYEPAMGAKSDLLPWSVASYLETTNVGTGMYSVSFVEMVIAVYDWGGSKDPYRPDDQSIYMLTVDKGMQHFPDACHKVLNLDNGVLETDGQLAQVQVGMAKDSNGIYSYTAPNLTADAQPPNSTIKPSEQETTEIKQKESAKSKQRVHLNHKVSQLKYDPKLYGNSGGMHLSFKTQCSKSKEIIEQQRTYPYVITTLPNGNYLNGDLKENLLENLSFAKAQALRECNYMPSFKAFLTFDKQFWAVLGERQEKGLGVASTDRPNRQIVYPSYGYEASKGVLQIYCWAQDAERLGALTDEERINECLKGIDYLYPDANIYEHFSGYHPEVTTKTWFWDAHAGGGAFALFAPEQFKNLYATLLTPEFDGCLNFAGECCSVHHGWIVGALDSAYNSVYHILQQAGATEKIKQMQQTWGHFNSPDIAADTETENDLAYAYKYNKIDRQAAAIPPGAIKSIYGDSDYIFKGNVPSFIKNYDAVPQSMKKTLEDKSVLEMLNNQWDDNVRQRAIAEEKNKNRPIEPAKTAVEMLEQTYYGENFKTIPKPLFWLKDDDEFARQQLAGFMPNLLTKVSLEELVSLIRQAEIPNIVDFGDLEEICYVADYRKYLKVCTVTPVDSYLAQPIVFFKLTNKGRTLMPVGIQLEKANPLFTPTMKNAENAWLLAKMQTNCAGQTLHDVGFHQLYTHQICAMVSISLFSEEVFNPITNPGSSYGFQEHPVFKLLRPHVVKTVEFQQTIYNKDYHPNHKDFPETRVVNGSPGVYNIGFVYDLIFSCGRIGNYQLQDKMYNDDGKFRFLDLALPIDVAKRKVEDTPFSYAYVHDAGLWYEAIEGFVTEFVTLVYANNDKNVAEDIQLQRFFDKLIPAFNHQIDTDEPAKRFPKEVLTINRLKQVLTLFVWQFSVQHTVINNGAYNQAAFVPNASTLMMPLPNKPSEEWTAEDVVNGLPSTSITYPELGGMNFMDVQINASVTGQGPYPETLFGKGTLEPSIDILQDSYTFVDPKLRTAVDNFYQSSRQVWLKIQQRQGKDIAEYMKLNPNNCNTPETVVFDLLNPTDVMNTIQT